MPRATEPRVVAEASGVSKSFRNTRALSDVSMTVTAGRQHALLGRNGAGKSTLVSILTGIVPPDGGTISFEGRPSPPRSAPEKWRSKVACVYQQSSLVPSLSVVENLFLNQLPKTAFGFIAWSCARQEAEKALSSWGLDLDVDAAVSKLTIVQKKLVEIVRALLQGSRFIILDEPTAHLEPGEIAKLFERMRGLANEGVTFLYISHHLEEIFQVCDEATILRDGRVVASGPVASFGHDGIVKAMVGSAAAAIRPAQRQPRQDPDGRRNILEIDGLTIPRLFTDIDLTLKTGERIGVAGSGSSGSVELAETIAGLRRSAKGAVRVAGRQLRPGQPCDAIAAGLGFIPGDRVESGYCPNLGVGENIGLPVMGRFTNAGWLRRRALRELGRRMISQIGVVASSQDQPIVELSGGNQQKAVIGRAFVSDPKVLVLIKPTAGVDVASKAAVFELISNYAEAGVLVVSDERDDLELCERVVVMRRGTIVEEFGRGWTFDQIVGELEGVHADE
jgi:simple sugar transport system ATP-binding protein